MPCDLLATSDDWAVTKPDVALFEKLIEVSGHRPDEIAYVGDRLDNDIAPAAKAGLFTVWIRRGPWGYVQQPCQTMTPAALRKVDASLEIHHLRQLSINISDR
ncbi:hypothetical protein GCM10009539_85190 [Cryptosporangium japonicum]|uniref:HAD family hydrolase n=1 Tax=Cryptosporangium japonicum TaxID=80872 RepID=A0ABN0VAW8_9ACTN